MSDDDNSTTTYRGPYCEAHWNRALSEEEMKQFHNNPYAFLIFERPTSWSRMRLERIRRRIAGWFTRS